MKNCNIKSLFWVALCMATLQLTSCKKKEVPAATVTENTTATSETIPAAEPVTISEDSALTRNLQDATKDFPTVSAKAIDGTVTLSGSIERDRLPALMQCVQQLHPKKVKNHL